MDLPAQLFIYLVIVTCYIIYKKKKSFNYNDIFSRLGFSFSFLNYYLLALLLAALSFALAVLMFHFFPIDRVVIQETAYKNYNISTVTFPVVFLIFMKELFYTAIGEELFFRGLIGGYFFRNYSFIKANILQTIVFTLPHALLLLISMKLLPLLILISISGWILGWLRYKSHSILPGILAHSLVNTTSILLFYSNV